MKNKQVSILTLNFGINRLKIAHFRNTKNLAHLIIDFESFNKMKDLTDQIKNWKLNIKEKLLSNRILIDEIHIFAIESFNGAFKEEVLILTKELADSQKELYTKSNDLRNLFSAIIFEIASELNKTAYLIDFTVKKKLSPELAMSGLLEITRSPRYNKLYQEYLAKFFCKKENLVYEKNNVIVCHMGSETTIGAHINGDLVDINDNIGEGPFGLNTAGALPTKKVIETSFKGDFNAFENQLNFRSGLKSYFGDSDFDKILININSNEEAKLIIDSMIYQIAQEIGRRTVILNGKIDLIILSGDMNNFSYIRNELEKWIEWICPIKFYNENFESEILIEQIINFLEKK